MSASDTRRDGTIPLRFAVLLLALVALLLATGSLLYYRSLASRLLQDAPIQVVEVRRDEVLLGAAGTAIEAAQAAGVAVELSEEQLNAVLLQELLEDGERAMRLRLAAPFVRLELSQKDPHSGRYVNARFLGQLAVSGAGLQFVVLSGTVGEVSIDHTEGEWARKRIEGQLSHEWARNPRTARLFAGLREVSVRDGAVRLQFAAPAPGPG